ncbi:CBS domain-containing protein [Aerococcaceae bacterium DSM 111020]|nr:CBS domain-containing protein [Aerococcaceae bacterium DSM 111020]
MTNIENLTNYEKFLRAFNTLHETLGKKLNQPNLQFGALLKVAEKNRDKVVMNYLSELDFYREFRNFLVHQATIEKPPVAEPNDFIIDEINDIIASIENPKKVYELFINEVIHFNMEDSLSTVLRVVNEKEYSQFPVFNNNELIGLVSENGITRFLAESVNDDIISIVETKVKDVIDQDEAKGSISIVNSNTLIHDVEEIFNKKLHEGNSFFAILVSNRGHKIEKPEDIVGIITPWDLPIILDNM